jgi:hypothetical protein
MVPFPSAHGDHHPTKTNMLTTEFPEFESIVRRLEKVFSKKIDDETMQAYWGALKDLRLGVFRGFAERHERFGRFFPKPSELRAKEDKLPNVPGGKDDADFRAAEAMCVRNLEALRGVGEFDAELRLRKLDRLIATEHPSTPAYAMALNEWREARGLHVSDKEWGVVR